MMTWKDLIEQQERLQGDVRFQYRGPDGLWRQFAFADASLESLVDKLRAFAIAIGHPEAAAERIVLTGEDDLK